MNTAVTTYRRASDMACNEVPDGYVVYDPRREEVHYLNLTAAAVFELCDGEATSAAIAQSLQVVFGLEHAPGDDVDGCLKALAAQGLITPVAHRSPAT